MSTITTIQASDFITNSRTDINTNFSNLNTDKIETSTLDTDTTLAANSDSKIATQKAVKSYIDAGGSADNLTRLLPTGSILPYGGSSAPTYFLLCDGASKDTTTYAGLFAVIGYSYGGSGASFLLPDLRARTPIGAGTGTKVATFASRSSNTITVTGLTNASNNEFQTGQAVTYHTTGSTITGLSNDTVYYIIYTSNLSFTLASTLANAQNNTPISLSSDGGGTQTFTLTFTARTVGGTGGEETHAMNSSEILAHTHVSATQSSSGGAVVTGIQALTASSQGSTSTSTSGSVGANVAMNNMIPFATVNYIIKI